MKYEFNDCLDIELTHNGVAIVAGGTAATVEASDPRPAYKRGIWFDGTNDYLNISGLSLNHSFTMELWVRIYNERSFFTTTDGVRNTKHIILEGNTGALRFTESFGSFDEEGTLQNKQWQQIAFTAEWLNDTRSTRISLYTNAILRSA